MQQMNELDKKQLVKKLFSPVYSKLSNHYRGLFSPSMNQEKAKHCLYWIEQLASSDIEHQDIPRIAEEIMASKKYQASPPNPSQFVDFALNKSSLKSIERDSFSDSFSALFDGMRERYRYLFDKSNENSESSTYAFWLDELKNSGATIEQIERIFKMLPNVSLYLTYPPSINEVLLMIKISSFSEKMPLVHQSLDIALSKEVDVHPIINYCRYKIDIRKTNKKDIIKRFNDLYADAAMRYIDGNLDLSSFKEDRKEILPQEDVLSSDELIKNLDDLLKSL